MKIEISPTTPAETKAFEEIEWTAVDQEHWGREIEWKLQDYRFKAVEDGKIVGIIFGKYEAGTTYIDNLLVGKDRRGKGIGSELMGYLEKWTLEQGGHKIWLVTNVKWSANSLYVKLRYERTVVLKKHFLGEDFALYEKFLA